MPDETALMAQAAALYAACTDWLDDQTNDAEFADQLRLIISKINNPF